MPKDNKTSTHELTMKQVKVMRCIQWRWIHVFYLHSQIMPICLGNTGTCSHMCEMLNVQFTQNVHIFWGVCVSGHYWNVRRSICCRNFNPCCRNKSTIRSRHTCTLHAPNVSKQIKIYRKEEKKHHEFALVQAFSMRANSMRSLRIIRLARDRVM